MKILITGGKSAVALKISKAFEHHEVILADYGEVPMFSSSKYQLMSIGALNLEHIAHTLLSICLDCQVDVLLPLYEFEFEPIAKADVLFGEFNIKALLPKAQQLNLFSSHSGFGNKWLAVIDGKIVYRSYGLAAVETLIDQQLNGVFYVIENENQLILSQVKI